MKIDARAVENVGNLRHRAGRAEGQPVAGHARAVAQRVEACVVNRRLGREIEDDHRHLRASDHRQHGRGKRVGRDVQEDQVHVRAPELPPGLAGALGVVHQAEVDDLDARPRELLRHAGHVALQSFLEPGELRPVSVQADAEETDAERSSDHGGSSNCHRTTERGGMIRLIFSR